MPQSDPAGIFGQRCESYAAERDRLDALVRRLAHIRMATFLGGAVCLLGAWDVGGWERWALIALGTLLFGAFVSLISASSRTKAKHRLQEELRKVNEDAIHRVRREWNLLPELDYGPPPDHPYAADLDLFGHASLFQLLGTAATIPGRETLRKWLLEPAPREEILSRQEAVSEMAPLVDYRNTLEAKGRLVGREKPQALHALIDWTKGDDWILEKPLLVWTVRLLPLLTVLSLTLHITGVLSVPLWALFIGVNVLITLRTYQRMHAVFGLVASGDAGLRHYAPVFDSASAGNFGTPHLQDLLRDMPLAAQQLQRLDQILAHAEVRYSGMLYGIVQLLLLWDQNVLCLLERWRRQTGPHVEQWVEALGQLEALAALAALWHAHPDWALPNISDHGETPTVHAKAMGHPLLASDVCVTNDVKVGPPGSFLFVTGSNMSGKSTLLRSIGVNAVLAQAGGPVFAAEMRMPIVAVFTSMRVSDSLDLGISQYMAQLSRLKLIVDGASEAGPTIQALYLLDEILQGTNSAERLVAVRRIVRRLLDCSAIGAVTSHELTVPEVPELSASAQVVHFRETAVQTDEGVTLSFDYKMRPGLSTSTNALKLMEMVGLE